jgi:ATP-dependent Clp protease ATP-binding subunit ClpC
MNKRPYSTRAQRALVLADGAAATLHDEFIGTEHLLLGLLEERTGPAAQILQHLGVSVDRVRELLLASRRPTTPDDA